MSFMNGIGLNSMMGQFAVSNELQTLTEIQKNQPNANAFGLTMQGKAAIAQVETQNEDNTTFLFEYRAYLNSQLTTLVTKLTNAVTSDLDVAMTRTTNKFNNKNNMQGKTDNVNMDPGAGRVAWDYLASWRSSAAGNMSPSGATNPTAAGWPMASSGPGSWALDIRDGTLTADGVANSGSGTFAVITYGNNPVGSAVPNDTFWVNYNDLNTNYYNQGGNPTGTPSPGKAAVFNVTDTGATRAAAGNKFEEVLFRESRTAVFRSILKADLMKDLVISASSSLSTGSQVQASISLNARFTNAGAQAAYPGLPSGYNAAIDVFLNRFTSFYHT